MANFPCAKKEFEGTKIDGVHAAGPGEPARLTRKLRAADRARYSTLRTMLRLPLADRECILHAAIAYLRARDGPGGRVPRGPPVPARRSSRIISSPFV